MLDYLRNIDPLLRLVVYAFAVYRVTHLLNWENGPWDVLDWLRWKAGVEVTYAGGTPHRIATTFWSKLILCPYCLSVWLAVPAVPLWLADFWVFDLLASWMAIAGFVALANSVRCEE
jgi:hypothetical protein